ncbi:MAG: hypothetical protein QOI03_1586 [Solirubrobacteraceae bacterium]|nr:hypothetical protein [Solirubrobacteraceae bacterium]
MQPSGSARSPWRALGLLALAAAGATVLYLLRPGALTEDTYAFLDWGRDLRHGYLPLLEHRTFHPVPILAGSLLSLLGSAAPTATVLAALGALVLLACACWRVVRLLGFAQPAPALAALLVLSSPLLSLLAQIAYINLPFAALLMWALVLELEERRAGAWTLLVLAGLVRPEGWAFLLAYGALRWWRTGRPREPRRLAGLAALALGPMVLWLLLEWQLFGRPLYSFTETRAPNVPATGSGTPSGLWTSLHFSVPFAPLIAAALGVIAIARLAPRRAAVTVLGMTAVAAVTLGVLASLKFNVPGRHFSVFVALVCVLAAAGAAAPARALARAARSSPRALVAVGAAGAALVAGLAVAPTVTRLEHNFRTVRVTYRQRGTLDRALTQTLRLVDVRGARRHSVALVGVEDVSEVVWGLGVPYNVVTDAIEPHTLLIVEPSRFGYHQLGRLGLTNRPRLAAPHGWRLLVQTRDWQVWAPAKRTPIRLS